MPTEEELEKTYSQMATDDLLYMMARKGDYTGEAIDAATRELQRRKVSPTEIKSAHAIEDPYKKLWMENCLYDLTIWQKAAYYFLSLPVWIGYRIIRLNSFGYYRSGWASYKPQGFILKSQQSAYYQITGIAFFVLSIILYHATTIGGGAIIFFSTWILGFGLSFVFDLAYNRQRLSGKLRDAIDAGELPWGV